MNMNRILDEKDSLLLLEKAKQFKEAKKWNEYFMYLTQSANLGNKESKELIRDEYMINIDGKQVFDEKLVNFYKKGAEMNLPYSLNYLAHMYHYGKGVDKNINRAKELYELAIEKGSVEAIYNLGYVHLFGQDPDYKKGRELFDRACDEGFVESITGLGLMYQFGKGVEKDHAKAKEYYEISIKKGGVGAMYNLGNVYLYGEGVDKDYAKAKELLEMACEKGQPDAMFLLGTIYLYGKGVEHDYAKAKELLEMAIEKNVLDAMFHIGYMYEFGVGMDVNYEKAIELYKVPVKSNHVYIEHIFNRSCLNDHIEIVEWLLSQCNDCYIVTENGAIVDYGFDKCTRALLEDDYSKALDILGIKPSRKRKIDVICLKCKDKPDKLIELECGHCFCLKSLLIQFDTDASLDKRCSHCCCSKKINFDKCKSLGERCPCCGKEINFDKCRSLSICP